MSVLIKGMDMPKNCCICKFCTRAEVSQCTITGGFTNWEYYHDAKRDDCPLVNVPTPHGKLIDADELIRMAKKWIAHPDPYISKRNKDFIYFLEKADAVLESTPTAQQWIPVSERLPEINKPVLVWVYDEYYLSELHSIDGVLYWDFDQFDLCGDEFDDVVAWMPLPEPYKGNLK